MRYLAVLTALFAVPANAQYKDSYMPAPFEDMAHVVCADQEVASNLLTVFEGNVDRGEQLLSRLTQRGQCERATFSGKPIADVHSQPINKQKVGHILEVEVTKGDVLKGRTRVYMLLYILHNNEA